MNLFRQKNFRKLWLAQVVSQFGDGVADLAIVVLVALTSNNAWLVGLVMFAQLLPAAVFGPFFGPLVDRMPRKRLMVIADLYRFCMVLLMIPFTQHPVALVVLVALHGLGTALFAPARSAVIPELVGEANVAHAQAISQSTWSAMRIAGPAIGGILLAVHNAPLIFIIDACTFFLSAALIASLHLGKVIDTPPVEKAAQESYLKALQSGIRQVFKMPALRFLLLLFFPVTLAAGIFNTSYHVVLLQTFHISKVNFGLMESVFAVGTIAGALFAPAALKRFRPSTMLMITCGLLGFSFIAVLALNWCSTFLGLAPIFTWVFDTGILNALINVPVGSLFITVTPAEFRGRGSALLQAAVNAGTIIGVLAGGWMSTVFGALTATSVAGIILVTTAVTFPWLKGYQALHAVRGRRPLHDTPIKSAQLRNGENTHVEAETTP
ncbi:MAG: MFS transporter [Alicyclobacillus sp.]|nr:MFS transporter [Alicyclobacillus sp.]